MKTAHGGYSVISTDKPAPAQPELHHGDLRKGAFLRRRAAWQMQGQAGKAAQAGDTLSGSGLEPAKPRQTR